MCKTIFLVLEPGEVVEYLDNRTSYGAKAQKTCIDGYLPASNMKLEYYCSKSGWKKINETMSFRCFNSSSCPRSFQTMVSKRNRNFCLELSPHNGHNAELPKIGHNIMK